MRALYLENTHSASNEIEIDGDDHHHLANVTRCQLGDEVLLLDGLGNKTHTKITTIAKKKLTLEKIKVEVVPYNLKFSVLILVPKKEALDLMLKSSVEMGVSKIFLCRGARSSDKLPEISKIQKIVKQAIEQSNLAWMPEIFITTFDEVDFGIFDQVNLLDVPALGAASSFCVNNSTNQLLVVGPEGGFSMEELKALQSVENLQKINFPAAILRSPTALVAGLGWLYAQL
jgi:16S rRNA (uracil1498-N3)-methyltransferase